MLKVTTYGAAGEIGRSCILIEDKDRKILLDCGLKIRPDKPTVAPTGILKRIKDINNVILSHAHFDHSGYIPRLIKDGYKGDVHMTHPTKDIISVLWRDHLKIEGERHWTENDMYDALYQIALHYYEREFKVADGITAKFYDAGHILGAASVLLDWDGQLIFYTGDINTFQTPYHDGNKFPTLEDISLVISEATNGLRDLPNRRQPNKDFIEAIHQTRKRRGVSLVPTFALGRGQELEAILARNLIGSDYQIYCDGMLLKMNRIYRNYFHEYWVSKDILQWCKEHRLEVPFDLPNFIPISRNLADNLDTFRKMIVTEDRPNIILSTSGMLEGGPIHTYLNYGGDRKENMIALTGYQVEGTTGREVLEGARTIRLFDWGNSRGTEAKIEAQVRHFSFSGHAQRNELIKMLKAIKGEKMIFVHSLEEAAKAARSAFENKKNIYVPKMNQTIKIHN